MCVCVSGLVLREAPRGGLPRADFGGVFGHFAGLRPGQKGSASLWSPPPPLCVSIFPLTPPSPCLGLLTCTQLVFDSAPTWSSRCCFTTRRF